MDNHEGIMSIDSARQKSEDRHAFQLVTVNLGVWGLEDQCTAYDLALLALSRFFFSWLAAIILSMVSY